MQAKRRLHVGRSLALGVAALMVFGSGAFWPAQLSAQEGVETISRFVAAFNSRDVDAIMAFFAEDAVYHNMPAQPVKGTAAIRRAIESFVSPASRVDWEILRIAQAGNAVLTERVDRFVVNGKEVVLPVMGTFELAGGKITAWRDYFDLATWQRQAAR
jgi:limonene-1,2-epoxide hydrolase